MNTGYASRDCHGKLTKEFFNMQSWVSTTWGGGQDTNWKSLQTTTRSIKPVTRDVIPEHYAKIRDQVTRPWPEARQYKSFEPRREIPPWGGNEVVYNSNA